MIEVVDVVNVAGGMWRVEFSKPVRPGTRQDTRPRDRWYIRGEEFPDRMAAFKWALEVIREQETVD